MDGKVIVVASWKMIVGKLGRGHCLRSWRSILACVVSDSSRAMRPRPTSLAENQSCSLRFRRAHRRRARRRPGQLSIRRAIAVASSAKEAEVERRASARSRAQQAGTRSVAGSTPTYVKVMGYGGPTLAGAGLLGVVVERVGVRQGDLGGTRVPALAH